MAPNLVYKFFLSDVFFILLVCIFGQVMGDNDTPVPNRRTVLKTVGASTAFGVMSGVASGDDSRRNYVGASYDTTSHMEQRRATGQFKSGSDGIKGRLKVGGFHVDFGDSSPLQAVRNDNGARKYVLTSEEANHKREGEPLRVHFTDFTDAPGYTDHISGFLNRRNPKFSKLGFTIGEPNEGYGRTFVRGLLNNRGKGTRPVGYDEVPEVPSEGIAKNTSIRTRSERARGGSQ